VGVWGSRGETDDPGSLGGKTPNFQASRRWFNLGSMIFAAELVARFGGSNPTHSHGDLFCTSPR